MRITTDWNASNPSNPCAAATRAEFEDYTVSVIAPPACLPSSASVSSVTDVTANLNFQQSFFKYNDFSTNIFILNPSLFLNIKKTGFGNFLSFLVNVSFKIIL